MSNTITEITPEQEARIPEWVDKWTKIGLSTKPADFEKAEKAALTLYQLAGFEKPKTILRVASPYAAVEQGYNAWNSQKNLKIMSKVGLHVELKIESKIWLQVYLQIELKFWSKIDSQIGLKIDSQITSKIWSKIDSQITSKFGSQDLMYNLYNGAFWVSNCASISFLRDVLNWQDPLLKNFKIYEDLVISCGHIWWHEDVLVISDRPEQIHLDNQGELHSESGPAIAYRDGYSQWYWHGVFVPQLVIEKPQDITVEMIEKENNTEVRRIMVDRFGEQGIVSYLLASKNKILNHDKRWGTLYYRELQNDEPLVMIKVINRTLEPDGSFKHYFLRVPSTIKTAHEAVAWSFGKVPGKRPIPGQRRQGDVLIERYESKEYYPESES